MYLNAALLAILADSIYRGCERDPRVMLGVAIRQSWSDSVMAGLAEKMRPAASAFWPTSWLSLSPSDGFYFSGDVMA